MRSGWHRRPELDADGAKTGRYFEVEWREVPSLIGLAGWEVTGRRRGPFNVDGSRAPDYREQDRGGGVR